MITKEQLIDKIEDLELDDAELAKFLVIDEDRSEAFNIAFKANPEQVLNLSSADEGVLGFLNKRSRRKRQRIYNRKIKKGFKGTRIVSEGDSWFQYPIFLKDIIDNLNEKDDFAIYSLGYGGDWLSNIYREQEYIRALRQKQPTVFLLSGGGNDLAGKNRLATLVHYFDESKRPSDYLNEESVRFMNDIKLLYKKIFDNVTNEFPSLKILFHGYDYALPNEDVWLGKPLISRGIEDRTLQAGIIKVLIDMLNEIQIDLASNYENVHHVDFRGIIDKQEGWKDALHPTNDYYAKISDKMSNSIVDVLQI